MSGVRQSKPEDRTRWQPFIEAACAAVDVDPHLVDADAILALTRTVAHAGARPVAPVAAHIAGIVTARGVPVVDACARVEQAAAAAGPLPR